MRMGDCAPPDSAATRAAEAVLERFCDPPLARHWWRSAGRCDLVARIVRLHMASATDPRTDPVGHLLDVATGLDISAARADDLPEPFVLEVLAAFPREGLAASFGPRVLNQAVRKPASQPRRVAPVAVRALARHPLGAAD